MTNKTFNKLLPLLQSSGKEVLHTLENTRYIKRYINKDQKVINKYKATQFKI